MAMNRNVDSRFAQVPTIGIGRSTFKRDNTIKTSFDVGQLIPFYCDMVMPGDTFDIKTSKVLRMPMFQTAPMDNLYLDTYYFFVPYRLVWSHFKNFMGEPTESAWKPTVDYTMPQIVSPDGGWNIGTLADYFGVPTGVSDLSINALPFRAYANIVNDWFVATTVDDPVNFSIDDATVTGVNTGDYVTDLAKGGLPFVANKYFDIFTACTPEPQRGSDVLIPFGNIDVTGSGGISGTAPVTGNGYGLALTDGSITAGLGMHHSSSNTFLGNGGSNKSYYFAPAHADYGKQVGVNATVFPDDGSLTSPKRVVGVPTLSQLGEHPEYSGLAVDLAGVPVNLNISTDVTAGSINQLRLAFQLQKFYERLALYGNRYIEIIKGQFGVTSPDARLQRTEYLGGNRIPITISEVLSTVETASTPQGTPTGSSLTSDVHHDFEHSFTEHGLVIGLMVARYDHTYQQGLDKMWTVKDKFDLYWPLLANIGNQAITNDRIYCQGASVIDEDTGKTYDEEVFGYQEAWAEYRYKPNMVTGQMRSSASLSLDVWHFGDDYASMPYLSSDWMKEDKTNIDRCLVVPSTSGTNQLFADIYVVNKATRPMPLYSIPGLIDHH